MITSARRTFARLAAAAAIIIGAGAGIACNAGDNDDASPTSAATSAATPDPAAQEMHESIEATAAAWNAADVDAFAAGWTDDGFVNAYGEPGVTLEDLKARMRDFIGAGEIGHFDFLETAIEGDSATVDAQYTVGVALERSIFTMVRVDGAWLIDAEETDVAVKIPEGATSIDVGLTEFTFNVSTDDIARADGTIVIASTNTGLQDHELGLIRADEGVNVLETLTTFVPQGPEDPDGLTFLGGDYVITGETSTIAFHEPLAPGRYALVCMLPDTNEGGDGTPHALKGMLTEFTVE